MRIQQISLHDTVKKLEKSMEVSDLANQSALQVVIIAEYLRRSLFQLSFAVGKERDFEPVYVRKVGHAVRRQLSPIWGDLSVKFTKYAGQVRETNLITWTLKRLTVLGDCIHLGDGYWIPGPVRTIKLPESNHIMVTGGTPTKQLSGLIGARCMGLGRTLNETSVLVPQGRYEDWVGSDYIAPNDLIGWIKRIVDLAATSGTASSSSFQDYEVFASTPVLRFRNRRSWVPAQLMADSQDCEQFMLCRMGKPIRYFVGEFQKGTLKREYPLNENMDHRWLELGFYGLHGSKGTATYRNNVLRLYPFLPTALQRHFMTYAVPIPTNLHTFGFVLAKESVEPAQKLLESYGYTIKGELSRE